MNAWFFLALAITLEVSGTFLLKLSNGFEKWQWGALSIACYSACFWVLAPAMTVLPVAVVYAIWAGVGIVAAAIIGIAALMTARCDPVSVHRDGAGRCGRVAHHGQCVSACVRRYEKGRRLAAPPFV